MHDPTYKRLFSQPRMVQDLLRGFVARDWSDALDFSTLSPVPASFVSHRLRQRHGDLVWQVRFRGDWLYLLVLLEFQSTVESAMAVRVLTYTGLLYEKLIDDGVLRRHGKLPPVLPIVIYNGSKRWTAAEDVAEMIAGGGEALARYQPSLRYYLLDEGRVGAHDLPRRNLVSSLITLETNREQEQAPVLLAALIERLRELGDTELTRVFQEWVEQVLVPRGPRGTELEPMPRLEEVRTMLAEQVKEWTAEWVAEGREQGLKEGIEQGIKRGIERGIEQGIERGIEQVRAEERRLLCRQAARKFTAETAPRLSALLERLTDPERLAQVGEWIIECETDGELLDRVQDATS